MESLIKLWYRVLAGRVSGCHLDNHTLRLHIKLPECFVKDCLKCQFQTDLNYWCHNLELILIDTDHRCFNKSTEFK